VIIPDVNVLVYAHRVDVPRHDGYRDWLVDVLEGDEPVGLLDTVLLGVVRLVTNPRLFREPATTAVALRFVDEVRGASAAQPVHGAAATWQRLRSLVDDDQQLRANLVPDGWLAAIALSQGARIATADRGFGRYPGLRFYDPAPPPRPPGGR